MGIFRKLYPCYYLLEYLVYFYRRFIYYSNFFLSYSANLYYLVSWRSSVYLIRCHRGVRDSAKDLQREGDITDFSRARICFNFNCICDIAILFRPDRLALALLALGYAALIAKGYTSTPSSRVAFGANPYRFSILGRNYSAFGPALFFVFWEKEVSLLVY